MQWGHTIMLHHYGYINGIMTGSIEHQSFFKYHQYIDLAKAKGEAPVNEFEIIYIYWFINLLQTINL